jgi:nucleoside-diphosphate-sugar epimerase
MKKLVVCGAAGFLGQNLIPLLKKKYIIIAIDKHFHNLNLLKTLNPEIETVYSDLAELTKWKDTFKSADCIIQLNAEIASHDKHDFIRNNVITTKNIVDIMKKYKTPYLVHVSSAAVNSIRRDYYSETKEEGEGLVRKSGVKHTILRPSMMYGCFDNKNVGWLMNFMKKSPLFPIPGSGKYPRQPVFVTDFCSIIENLIENKPDNKIYNINGDKIDFIDMVKVIIKSKKIFRPIVKLPFKLFIFLMQSYSFVLRKVEFTPDQIRSLTSGEIFEMFPWWSEFDVEKTSFKDGVHKMLNSKFSKIVLER